MNCNCKYDILGFANELGLSIKEVHELYAELITEVNSSLLKIKLLIDKKDFSQIQKIIHNIKGVSGNYRITDIYEETAKINDNLKAHNYTNIEHDLNNLFIISIKAQNEIRRFFA